MSLIKLQNRFRPLAGQPILHQSGRRRAKYYLAMSRYMIRMSVTNEDLFRAELWLVWIQPQSQFRKVQTTVPKFESQE
jgi:hypothetical protein